MPRLLCAGFLLESAEGNLFSWVTLGGIFYDEERGMELLEAFSTLDKKWGCRFFPG